MSIWAAVLAVLFLGAPSALLSQVINFGNLEGAGGNTFQIAFSPIGNTGNQANTTQYGTFGSVGYVYGIGTYEVTRDMVNKANLTARLGVTMLDMSSSTGNGTNKPATGLSWQEIATFVNYLNTSRGLPPAYKITGGTLEVWSAGDLGYDANNPFRNNKANYFIPTVDEWCKAAYYDPNKGGSGVAGYWVYPPKTDTAPVVVSSGTAGGTAVYSNQIGPADVNLAGGISGYGTFGQGGNVREMLETATDRTNNVANEARVVAGGDWGSLSDDLQGGNFSGTDISGSFPWIGFRVVRIAQNPETNPKVYSATVFSNVAIGKTVTASSVFENNSSFSADRIVNGSTSETSGSYWLAKGTGDSQRGTLPAWLVIDLGQTYPVSGVSILNAMNAPFNDRGTKDISVQVSTNGTNYTTMVTSNTLTWQNTSFQDQPFNTVVTARYVKVNITSTYGSFGGAALNEVRVNSPQEVISSFILSTIIDSTKGSINANPSQSNYSAGEIVTLTATALPGFIFSSWSGDAVGTEPSISVTMDSNKSVTANFSQDTADADSDGLSNYQEIAIYGTNPNQKDSNTDGVEDGQAVSLGYSPAFNFGALITFIKTNPPSGLYSQTQYESQRTNGQNDILNAPNSYNLYTTNQIHNLGLGGIVLNRNTNNQLVLNYQVLQSSDLQSWSPYQQVELVVSNAPSDKMFLRVQAVENIPYSTQSYTGPSEPPPAAPVPGPAPAPNPPGGSEPENPGPRER